MNLSDLTGGSISNSSSPSAIIKSSKQIAVVSTVGVTGIGKFIFDVPTSTRTSLTSRTTNYSIVSGDIVSDNIINDNPEITLEGTFGVFSEKDTLGIFNQPTQFLGQKLSSLGSLGHLNKRQREGLNKLTQTTEGIASQLSSLTSSIQSIMTLLSLSTADTRASKVFDILRILRDAKVTFAVDSNTFRYDNCVITSLEMITDEILNSHTIRVTFKQIKTTKVADFNKLSQAKQDLRKAQDVKRTAQASINKTSELVSKTASALKGI